MNNEEYMDLTEMSETSQPASNDDGFDMGFGTMEFPETNFQCPINCQI